MDGETQRERYYRECEEIRAQMFNNQHERTNNEIKLIHKKTDLYNSYQTRVAKIKKGYNERGGNQLHAAKKEVERIELELAAAKIVLEKAEKEELIQRKDMEKWLNIAKQQYEQQNSAIENSETEA